MNLANTWLWRNIVWRLDDEKTAHDHFFRGFCKTIFVTQPRLGGRPLNRLVIQALAMAPKGSTIVVKEALSDISIEVTHPTLIRQGCTNTFFLRSDPNSDELIFYIDLTAFEGGPRGLGAVAFLRCAQMCQILGFARIDLLAAGGQSYKIAPAQWNPGFNGYYTWGVFGFNAPLHPQTAQNIQTNPLLAGCKDLRDIIVRDPQWWRLQGAGGEMTFDLQKGSQSWHTLGTYLSSNGYRK